MPQMSPIKWTLFILMMYTFFIMFLVLSSFIPKNLLVPGLTSSLNKKWKFLW